MLRALSLSKRLVAYLGKRRASKRGTSNRSRAPSAPSPHPRRISSSGSAGRGRRVGAAEGNGGGWWIGEPGALLRANPSVPRTGQCFRHQSARDVKNPISPFRSVKNTGESCLKIAFKSCLPSTRFAHRRVYVHVSLFQWPKSIDSAQIPSRVRIGYPPEIAKRQKLRRTQWRHPSVLLPADQRVVTHFDEAHKAWRYDC